MTEPAPCGALVLHALGACDCPRADPKIEHVAMLDALAATHKQRTSARRARLLAERAPAVTVTDNRDQPSAIGTIVGAIGAAAGSDVFSRLPSLATLKNEQARRSFGEFFRQGWPIVMGSTPLEPGRHLDAICETVEAQLRDRWDTIAGKRPALRAQNVLINVPPRSLKTTILTFATAWAWLHEPDLRIMYCSSNPRVVVTSGRMTQDLIASAWFTSLRAHCVTEGHIKPWQIRADQNAVTLFGNTLGGTRDARGIDSSITGAGSSWLIVDDPHDVRDSEDEIRKTVEGYHFAVHNRINDPRTSIRTAIMQRFRVDDFSGVALEMREWLHLRLPMEFDADPVCECGTCTGVNVYGWSDWRSAPGELLHGRYAGAWLDEQKIDPYYWAGQMQQRPTPPGGGLFQRAWFNFFTFGDRLITQARPKGCRTDPAFVLETDRRGVPIVDWFEISVDATFGAVGESASGVGLLVVAGRGQRRFVFDDRTKPMGILDALTVIRAMVRSSAAPVRKLIVEMKASGSTIVETIRKEIGDGTLLGFDGKPTIIAIEPIEILPGDNKQVRAGACVVELAAGLVYLLDGAPWIPAFVGEVCVFPHGKRDDRVDALSQILTHHRTHSAVTAPGYNDRLRALTR